MDRESEEVSRLFEKVANRTVKWAVGSWALAIVLIFIAAWLLIGPFMRFSDHWKDIMYMTSATVTLAMVFLLVRTQDKDTRAIHIKLNEVIAALHGANNQLINVENRSETAILELGKRYETVATKLQNEHVVSTESIVSHELAEEE